MPNALVAKLDEFAESKNFGTVGSLGVAIVITEVALEQGLPLNPEELITASGAQVKYLGKDRVQAVLARHGVTEVLASEGGRTSRGSVSNMRAYVSFLNALSQKKLVDLQKVEEFWVEKAKELIASRLKDVEALSFPAVPLVQNDQHFFFTTIPVSSLFPYCYVARREEDAKTGFQRRLNQGRAEDIGRYLYEGLGSIPTNIVLSAQPESGITYNTRSKTLRYQLVKASFLVLDGQHRLWGYQICSQKYGKELRVPVSIYIGLTRAEEARLFIDINTTQVGVPSALLLDIKQVAEIESSKEELLRGLFDDLNADENSPLHDLLSPSKSVNGRLSRVAFNKAMLPVIQTNVWVNTTKKAQYQLLLNYLRAMHSVVPEQTLFSKAAFFESICEVFDDVVRTAIAKENSAKEKALIAVLSPLRSVDFPDITQKSRATKAVYSDAIKDALKKSVSISDAMV